MSDDKDKEAKERMKAWKALPKEDCRQQAAFALRKLRENGVKFKRKVVTK